VTGFCRFLIDSEIFLHNALPTTKPSAFFNDDMVLAVIPKPITKFLELFIFLKKKNLFNFNLIFFSRFIRIIFSVIIMGFLFDYLIIYFSANLAYEQSYKSAYLVGLVFIGLISYLLIAVLIKAFKISDINLKY